MKYHLGDNHLLADSGRRYEPDGVMKTAVRLIFEWALDEKGAALKISNPEGRREN